MTRLKTIFVSDDNVDYKVNPAGDLWSYILILRVLYALTSVLQSDWAPDFRIRVRKVIRSPGDVSPRKWPSADRVGYARLVRVAGATLISSEEVVFSEYISNY